MPANPESTQDQGAEPASEFRRGKSTHRMLNALLKAQDRAARMHCEFDEMVRELDARAERIRQLELSTSFRLGFALVAATRSWSGLVALPRRLTGLLRRRRAQVRDESTNANEIQQEALHEDARMTVDMFQSLVDPADSLTTLRMACVLDAFTQACLEPECRLLALPAAGFEAILDHHRPHLLLVESAWNGTDGAWRNRIGKNSPQLRFLLDCCRRRGIPTVFWNKEDPSHFDYFLETARLFDHVFTTDADCIPRYRAALGHDRVYPLQFSCQPRLHHPIEDAERADDAAFAGSWYRQYPERSRDFERLVEQVSVVMPVVIYDRNERRGDPAFAYPKRYAQMLRPGLSYDQVVEEYRRHGFGLTVNTVKQSTTMFARRVYELLACNTIAISNSSAGLASVFGDCVLICDEDLDCAAALRELANSPQRRHAWRLRALRKVLGAHTAAHRLAALANIVLDTKRFAPPRANILVAAYARDPGQVAAVLAAFRDQSWLESELALVVCDTQMPSIRSCAASAANSRVRLLTASEASAIDIENIAQGRRIACFDPRDRYEADYLTDLALATLFAADDAVGKGAHFFRSEHHERLHAGQIYRRGVPLRLRSSLVPSHGLPYGSLLLMLEAAACDSAPDTVGIALDEFGYCRNGATSITDRRADPPVPGGDLAAAPDLFSARMQPEAASAGPARTAPSVQDAAIGNAHTAAFAGPVVETGTQGRGEIDE